MDTNGKLRKAALAHKSFLRKREMAKGQGISYPSTRSTKEINNADAPPGILGGVTGFTGMGSRKR
jgi:hypothetical protein